MSSEFLSMLGRLLLSALLGAVVGLQREHSGRPAGLRTHTLVCLGSALITLVSESYPDDPTRISAQIVSGIGFLGAGTIIREGRTVRGLTTAASLWAVAGLGIACAHGGQVLWLAVATAAIVVITLGGGKSLEDRLFVMQEKNVLTVRADAGVLPRVLQALVDAGITIESARHHLDRNDSRFSVHLQVEGGRSRSEIMSLAMAVPGVRSATWGGGQEAQHRG